MTLLGSCFPSHVPSRSPTHLALVYQTLAYVGKHDPSSVTEKVSRKPSWQQQGAQCHGKASWKAILVEHHGKAVIECVMETARLVASWKGVTEINICLASRKRCHRNRHGNSEVRSVMECVMESDTGGASWKSRDGMRHGKHDPCSVTERASWKSTSA